MKSEIKEIAQVFSNLEELIKIPVLKTENSVSWDYKRVKFYFVGGTARYLVVGGELPEDIDVYADYSNIGEGYDSICTRKIEDALDLLVQTGYLKSRVEPIDEYNNDTKAKFRRFRVSLFGRDINLDVLLSDYIPETTANFLRVRIHNRNINKVISCYPEKLLDAIRDSRRKEITVNPEILPTSLTERIWLWRRVMKYCMKGWILNESDEYTMQMLPPWLFEAACLSEEQMMELCPITHEYLRDCKHVICTPCGHYFNGTDFMFYMTIRRRNREKINCPVCREKITIIEDHDGDELSDDEDYY